MSGTDDCKEEASGYLELKATKLEYGEITFAIGGDSAADDNAPVVQGAGKSNVLSWEGLRCSVQGRPHGQVLEILHGVSGSAKSGELVAIIGPSGAGKSCFMDMLAASKTVGCVSGLVTFNGARASVRVMKAVSSYVTQETSFHPTQTVLEAVLFQAQLRLDASLPFEEKLRLSKDLVTMAGLQGKEVAFVFTAAYLAICSIAGGLYVSFPHIYHGVRWLQYLSILKYGFQALMLLLFKDNSHVVIVPGTAGKPPILAETVINAIQLDRPGTVGGNVLSLSGFYLLFIGMGYVFLRHLYKERR